MENFCHYFLKSKVKNSQRWYLLGRTPRRFLWCWSSFCCCYSSFVDVLPSHFFSFSLTLPWTIARFLDPFCTFSPAHRRVICDTFIFNHSVIFLLRALRFWVSIFYPQVFFTLCSFPTFWHNLFLSGFSGSPQLFLEIFRGSYWSLKHKPGPSVCLIHSNLLYILKLYLCMSILQMFYLWWKLW